MQLFMRQSTSYPATAFALSLIGGLFIAISGVEVKVLNEFSFVLFGLGSNIGFFGIAWGLVIIASACLLRFRPSKRVALGAVILAFAFLSWWGAIGGFVIGFLLSFFGGLLAVIWSPQSQISRSL